MEKIKMDDPKTYWKKNVGRPNIRKETYEYFFRKYIKGNQNEFFLQVHEGENIKMNKNPFWIPGRIYYFQYDPKYADVLSYYDERPVILCLDITKNKNTGNELIHGINLNFLPPQVRTTVLQFYWESFKNEIENAEKSYWEGKLFLTVQKVIKFLTDWMLQLKIFSNMNINLSFALRSYIWRGPDAPRIKNAVLIEVYDWKDIPFLDTKDLVGKSLFEIYKEYFASLMKKKKTQKRK